MSTEFSIFDDRTSKPNQPTLDSLQNDLVNAVSPYKYNGPVFAWVDDDSHTDFITNLKPTLDAKGVKVSIATITGFIGKVSGYMTLQDLLQMQKEGHEIVSHSTDHSSSVFRDNTATSTDADIESRIADAQTWLKNNGFNGYNVFVYPYGGYSTTNRKRIKDIARKYYKYGVNSGGGATQLPLDNMYVNRQFVDATVDFNTNLKLAIDSCISNNGLLVIGSHSGDLTHCTPANVAQVIDYIQSKGYSILTYSQAMEIKGNSISIGDYEDTSGAGFFVGMDGKTKVSASGATQILSGVTTEEHGYAMNDLITKYPYPKVTIFKLRNTYDLLLGEGGTLTTYRVDATNYYNYQTFVSATSNRWFTREYDYTNNVWLAWKEMGTSSFKIASSNLTTANALDNPITSYDDNIYTLTRVQSQADNLSGTGGMLLTYRSQYYSNQMFHSINKKVYYRTYNDGSSSWNGWLDLDNNNLNVIPNLYTDTAGNTMDDPISKFPLNKKTIMQIRAGATDTLTGNGGTIETWHGGMYFSYQVYYEAGDRVYKRRWLDDTSAWGPWKQFTLA
jgi:peptidoglycan/xylan/chitin deacetylase (PgdA/CDA1 family)